MKRILMAAVTVSLWLIPATVSAQPNNFDKSLTDIFSFKVSDPLIPKTITPKKELPKPKPVIRPKPKPVIYTVRDGDTLTTIGSKYKVKWQRLWAKNKKLKQPDAITIGDKITIPRAGEKLSRKLPAAISLPGVPEIVVRAMPLAGASGGNTYSYGYCTWYVKNMRGSSLPNGLGDANTWYVTAQGLGMATGTVPRKGAVGTTTAGGYGHVVFVESVNGDGTINISEMNYQGWNVVSRRVASASEFLYIY